MTAAQANLPPHGKKFCIACRELIATDATVCPRCHSSQVPEKSSWDKTGLKWIAAITAVVGLITGLSGVVGPLKGWWTQGRQDNAMLRAAQRQVELGEYAAALDTYADILKNDPHNAAATRERLDAAMVWVENFQVSGETDAEMRQRASASFARITPVLDAGLAGGQEYRVADVVAHLGMLNWLKQGLTYEDGPIEENYERALKMDPTNVYANAMIGNWLLLKKGSIEEAKKHFDIAVHTGRARPFVRECQLGGMICRKSPGVRPELIRVVNDVRKEGGSIAEDHRRNIRSYYDPVVASDDQLREILAAVPPDEAWATYQWINRPMTGVEGFDSIQQRYIQATIYEISGQRAEALQLFRQLQTETKNPDTILFRRIRSAVIRLSR